jgi:hypothetical protein
VENKKQHIEFTKIMHEITEDFTIGDLEERDIVNLTPIIRKWVRTDSQVIEAEVNQIRDGRR